MSARRKQQRRDKLANPRQSLPEVSLAMTPMPDACPVCEAEVEEAGGLGCCDAITADCVGSVDGLSRDELSDDDPRWEQLVRHSWYTDTREPAPLEGSGEPCRCEQVDSSTAHA